MSDGSKARETQFICDQLLLMRRATGNRHAIVCIEKDYSPLDADEMAGVIHHFMAANFRTPNLTILGERCKNAHGKWVTTAGLLRGPNGPHRHVRHFTSFLVHDKVRFCEPIHTLVPPGKSARSHGETLVEEIIKQLRDYRQVPTTSAAARLVGPTKYAISGKASGPDDLAVAMLWVSYALSIAHASASFAQTRGMTPEVICGSSNSTNVDAQGATDEARTLIRGEADEEAQRRKERIRCAWFPTDTTARAMQAGRGERSI